MLQQATEYVCSCEVRLRTVNTDLLRTRGVRSCQCTLLFDPYIIG